MKIIAFEEGTHTGLAIETEGGWRGHDSRSADYPGDLAQILAAGTLAEAGENLRRGRPLEPGHYRLLPPVPRPGKILCVGLNYADHAAETGSRVTDYPTFFLRVATTLVGHEAAILRPALSEQLDFEGEIAAIIGNRCRHLDESEALGAVAGYALFNDASVRDYQRRTSQFTPGKNFDATGAFGPAFVSADALPAGCKGLTLETRLNGETVQKASTNDMIFPVAKIIALASAVMTLEPGDIIVTGTPAGVGAGRSPPLWMKSGDRVEVEVDGIGCLSNPVAEG